MTARFAVGAALIAVFAAVPAQAAPRSAEATLVPYLDFIGANLIGRRLNASERAQLAASGHAALAPVIETWLESESFMRSGRDFIDTKLATSGKTAAIDFDRPGRLMDYLIRQKRPYSELLSRCKPDDNSDVYCDTGLEAKAGVLNTRAFLVSSAGRYNIPRARNTLRDFLCMDYPLPESLEPRAPKDRILPKFAVDVGANTNGNGSSCYLCHGQFALHTQLFVNFDKNGLFNAAADGQQDQAGEPGASLHNAYASHFTAVADSASPASQMLGVRVSGLEEAAAVIAGHPLFAQCAVRDVLRYYLKMDQRQAQDINAALIEQIAAKVAAKTATPTFQDYVETALVDPNVIASFSPQD